MGWKGRGGGGVEGSEMMGSEKMGGLDQIGDLPSMLEATNKVISLFIECSFKVSKMVARVMPATVRV